MKLRYAILSFLFPLLLVAGNPPANHPDANALVELYNNTDGNNWTVNTKWLDPGCDVCEWFGVICDNGRVVSIDLTDNGLNGTLPPELQELTQLEVFRLGRNQLSGNIPEEINAWEGLRELILSLNDLSGPIPPMNELGLLVNLQLSGNRLTGELPGSLLNRPNLERLYLGGNDLSGDWPDLSNLVSLRQLYLENNEFSGPLPALTQPLPDLFQIDLSGTNSVTGGFPASWENGLPGLETLAAASLGLSGPLPDITDWTMIRELLLPFNNFSGCYPANYSLFCAAGVPYDFVANPGLPDGGSDDFFADEFCPNGTQCEPCTHPDFNALVDFYNATNGVNWDAATRNDGWADGAAGLNCEPCTWAGITCDANDRVTRIVLLDKGLTGTLNINNWTELNQLRQLSLSLNAITGEFPLPLWFMDNLEQINLQDCAMGGDFPDPGSDANLRILDISGNDFFGGAPIFGNCPNLTTVSIADNDFSELGQSNINATSCPNLTTLIAQNNQFFELLPPGLGTYPPGQITLLRLDGNDFQGCYPPSYGSLCGANTFFAGNDDLPDGGSDAFFDDEFCQQGLSCEPPCHPDFDALLAMYNATDGPNWSDNTGWADGAAGTDCDVCSWEGITCNVAGRVIEINLPNNQLSGTLPAEMVGLTELIEIQLGNNQLTGALPNLSSIASLRSLRARLNQLSGNFPNWVAGVSTLEWIDITDNNFNGALPDLSAATGLVRLQIADNNFTGQLPSLVGMTLLEYADFGQNSFSGQMPNTWSPTNLPALLSMRFGNNQIAGELAAELGDLPVLLEIRVNDNLLTGCYPGTYANICGFSTIERDFSGNAGLPDGGSEDFFADEFCTQGLRCEPDCHPDYEALVALYNGTNGDDWTVNTNWLEDCDVCDWAGVSCNGAGRVSQLQLSNNNLTGTLPAELADLTEIFILNVEVNELTGPLPDLSGYSRLSTLRLRNNQLSGAFPAWVLTVDDLTWFDISTNAFAGAVPDVGARPNLARFLINTNDFTGTLPEVGSLPALQFSSFGDNDFTGQIPASWTAANLPALQTLDAGNNQLSGALPAALGNLPALTQLILSNNNLTGCYPDSYTSLCGINYNFRVNPGLPDGGSSTFFADVFCATGQNCDGPCHPDFDALMAFYDATDGPNWTDNTGWIDGAAGTDCNVCDWFGVDCNAAGRVSELELFENGLVGNLPTELNDLTELDYLDLSDNTISSPLTDLSALANLTYLELADCGLTGSFPTWLLTLSGLEYLGLSSNMFSGPLPDLTPMNGLTGLYLGQNLFSGSLPALGDKPDLGVISLGQNMFVGNVPGEWTPISLPELRVLSLGDNQLSGDLPAVLGNFPNMNFLQLDNNGFTGCYPASYTNLCDISLVRFVGNPGLPDGGSEAFFENQFCPNPGICNTLPVTWISFTATPVGKTVELHWVTDEEVDNAGFIVERSADGTDWTALSAQALIYTFTDERPLTGESIYRIRQTDFDGAVSYSELRRVIFEGALATVYPNPFRGGFTVVSAGAEEITVVDLTGRTVASFEHGGGAQVHPLALPAGVYVLRFGRSGQRIRVVAK